MERTSPWYVKLSAGLLSTVIGLIVAEFVVAHARDHAFHFVNIYAPDPQLGVVLEAHARTFVRSRDGNITKIETNSWGFRGPDWVPASNDSPVARRVMLVGDSQVLGYGVAWEETLAARLEERLQGDWEVLAAATPTWGPSEYVTALERLLPTFRPETVVFVANAANDWFETSVPNHRRHTARDGWATRVVDGDKPPAWFPLRREILGKSHLVYVVRRILRGGADGPPPVVAVSAQRLVSRLNDLRRPIGRYRSRVTPSLVRAKDLCARYGCQVIAAFLPMDVQVHPSEWTKYRTERPLDVRPTWVLGAAFLRDARMIGLPAVDWMPSLQQVSPGAFLVDDYHLSPTGHLACAIGLAGHLKRAHASRQGHRNVSKRHQEVPRVSRL